MNQQNCPDCNVRPGEVHIEGCDVEFCTECGGQRLQCGCLRHKPINARWTGDWPGKEACRQLGLYCKWINGAGWVKCKQDDKGACEDLNAWALVVDRVRRGMLP